MACLVISPYIKRGMVYSTLYTTSSMLRSIELLPGMPPLSQYDAAATPYYAAFGMTPDLTPFTRLPAQWDVNERTRRPRAAPVKAPRWISPRRTKRPCIG